MKKILQTLLPKVLFEFVKDIKNGLPLLSAYFYDLKRYYKHSLSFSRNHYLNDLSLIIRDYHVVEKGLTMPETRLGFGEARIIRLVERTKQFIQNHTNSDEQVKHSVEVLNEYLKFHNSRNFKIKDSIVKGIEELNEISNVYGVSKQKKVKKKDFFSKTDFNFFEFSNSRSSVRNYSSSEELDNDKLIKAIDLAKNTPSACNRQGWRAHIFSDKEKIKQILSLQGGNRGFGHLANKLIVITSDISIFHNSHERYQAYIDGGMFAMNILYSLHYYRVAGCILNCSHTPKKDVKMRELVGIPESELFIAMVSCGEAIDEFSVATSKRNPLNGYCKVIH